MIVGKQVRARCDGPGCPRPVDRIVPIPELVPGVLGWPRLVCGACGCDLLIVPEESAPDA